jgi:hypothetical protein
VVIARDKTGITLAQLAASAGPRRCGRLALNLSSVVVEIFSRPLFRAGVAWPRIEFVKSSQYRYSRGRVFVRPEQGSFMRTETPSKAPAPIDFAFVFRVIGDEDESHLGPARFTVMLRTCRASFLCRQITHNSMLIL